MLTGSIVGVIAAAAMAMTNTAIRHWDASAFALINPMLAYFWLNVAREFGINTNEWNISTSSPPQIAVTIATQPDESIRDRWFEITESLAAVNPGLLRRVADQIIHIWPDSTEYLQVADQLQNMI